MGELGLGVSEANLAQFGIVNEVGAVPVDESTEGQAILPAGQREGGRSGLSSSRGPVLPLPGSTFIRAASSVQWVKSCPAAWHWRHFITRRDHLPQAHHDSLTRRLRPHQFLDACGLLPTRSSLAQRPPGSISSAPSPRKAPSASWSQSALPESSYFQTQFQELGCDLSSPAAGTGASSGPRAGRGPALALTSGQTWCGSSAP